VQSKAATVKEYLASLPPDRREAIEAVRKVILKNLDKGYKEGMLYGMIGYYVPHSLYPPGYHCDPTIPIGIGGLASQKNYMSVYLMCIYNSTEHAAWFQKAWKATGKKLDMGKCCIRFKKAQDLALDVLGQAFKRVSVKECIAGHEDALAQAAKRKKSTKTSFK
jgi:hypothetical protein